MNALDPVEHEVARLLDERIGLKSNLSFRPRLTRALRDLAIARNIDDGQLGRALLADASLLDDLLDRITVQESGFFRHPEQFEAIARLLMPAIDGPLRAWSAASANGQEAYSLAMLFAEADRPGSVLASDVSQAARRRTADGRYADREMRGVSADRRRRHFSGDGDSWLAKQPLRDMVVAQRHNLIDTIPPHVATCQIVMCRNVLIYFGEPHARLFLDRLADVMAPNAHLFLGGAETMWQISDRFEPMQIGSAYAYRPRPRPRPVTGRAAATGTTPALRPPRSPRPKPVQSAGTSDLTVVEAGTDYGLIGGRLMADGLIAEAVVAFRQWSYDSPDDPLAHFQMGIALDCLDDTRMARRAYRAALAALDRCDAQQLANVLKGFERTELRNLLVARSGVALDVTGPPPIDRHVVTS